MKIDNIELEYDRTDYPDFCDAHILSCDIDGIPATDEQLDDLNEDRDFIYGLVLERLF